MKRFSKKRESIKQCLAGTKEHPSAEWVYNQLKPVYPDLSLGTVYRNLNQLAEEGEVRCVAVVQGKERYDACTEPHTHIVCTRCGRVQDVEGAALPPELIDRVQVLSGFKVSYSNLQFAGICEDCGKEQESPHKHGAADFEKV